MRKSFILGPIVGGVVLIVLIAIASMLKTPSKTLSEPTRAIPLNAGIVVQFNSFSALTNNLRGTALWNELLQFEAISRVDTLLALVDSVANAEGGFGALFEGGKVFLSIHPVGNNEAHLLITSRGAKGIRSSAFESIIKKNLKGSLRLVEQEHQGFSVSHVKHGERSVLVFAENRGIVMASTSPLLLERALKQQSNPNSLLTDRGFLEIQKTAGSKTEANIFIDHKNLPALFKRKVAPAYARGLAQLADVATWTELDPIVKPNAFFLNGFTHAPDSANAFLKWMSKQKPVTMGVQEVLPAQTAFFTFLGITSIDSYLQDYRGYLDRRGELRNFLKDNETLAKQLGVDPIGFFSSFFKNELVAAYIPFSSSPSNNWFVVLGTKGKSTAQAEILERIEAVARKNGTPMGSIERTIRVDRERSVKVYSFPAEQLHASMFGSLFQHCSSRFLTFIDSYVVFGPSPEALTQFALAQIHNRRLENSPFFKEFEQALAQESNFTLYINPQQSQFAFNHFVEPRLGSNLQKGFERASGIEGIAFQMRGGKALIFNNVCIKYGQQKPGALSAFSSPQAVWETQLDTVARGKPTLVLNHISNNREIFVQDLKNSIYLINDAGRILWKQRLAEPIMGEVQQVDLYKNGKLQLLFSTRTGIYAVDRNGNNVEGFPIKLPSLATNPVAVFDYEKNRDYRFFVALDNRQIVGFEKNGKPLVGWEFGRTERMVTRPLQHFRSGRLDFIVVADDNRLYLLDRRGKERIAPQKLFPPSRNGCIVLDESAEKLPPRFATTDSLGVVRFIYLDGRVEEKVLASFSPSHFFDYQDMDGDGQKEYIFLDGNHLKVWNSNAKERFSHSFHSEPLPMVVYFNFGGNDRKLGVTTPSQGFIYLINGDGKVYNNFPLGGYTPFSIGQFTSTKTKFNLIVGSSASSIVNYAVQ